MLLPSQLYNPLLSFDPPKSILLSPYDRFKYLMPSEVKEFGQKGLAGIVLGHDLSFRHPGSIEGTDQIMKAEPCFFELVPQAARRLRP